MKDEWLRALGFLLGYVVGSLVTWVIISMM